MPVYTDAPASILHNTIFDVAVPGTSFDLEYDYFNYPKQEITFPPAPADGGTWWLSQDSGSDYCSDTSPSPDQGSPLLSSTWPLDYSYGCSLPSPVHDLHSSFRYSLWDLQSDAGVIADQPYLSSETSCPASVCPADLCERNVAPLPKRSHYVLAPSSDYDADSDEDSDDCGNDTDYKPDSDRAPFRPKRSHKVQMSPEPKRTRTMARSPKQQAPRSTDSSNDEYKPASRSTDSGDDEYKPAFRSTHSDDEEYKRVFASPRSTDSSNDEYKPASRSTDSGDEEYKPAFWSTHSDDEEHKPAFWSTHSDDEEHKPVFAYPQSTDSDEDEYKPVFAPSPRPSVSASKRRRAAKRNKLAEGSVLEDIRSLLRNWPGAKEGRFECPMGCLDRTRGADFKRHLETHVDSSDPFCGKHHTCHCGDSFSRRDALTRHQRNSCGNKKRAYK